ncbi:MAG TPA: CHASE2 domain-containing protein [Burkholderiaceae bacterium]|nr:CHASE2 domain-containing protein [Burkholderiaceae bacterium]
MLRVPLSRRPTGIWLYGLLSLALGLSLTWGLASRVEIGLPHTVANLFLDSYLRITASGKPAQGVVVVDVDDVSLAAAGQWPWPRYRMAALIEAVAAAKPAAIGLDILFSEPDRTSLDNIRKSFKQDLGLDITFGGIPSGVADNDGYLAQVLFDTEVVGARYFYFDHISKPATRPRAEFRIGGKLDLLALNDAPGVLNNTEQIASRLRYSGFLNSQRDSDGMLRRLPLLIKHQGIIYPHLSLATLMRASRVDSATIDEDRFGAVIRVGRYTIPIDEKGFALLRFNGKPELYPAIPAVDVLNGSFDAADLRGKIVFVGSSAAALNDLHATIFDLQFPGLKIQAVTVDDILRGNFAREVPWSGNAVLLVCLLVGLSAALLFLWLRGAAWLFLGTGAVMALVVAASAWLFQSTGIFISPGSPLLLGAMLFTIFTTARYMVEKRQSFEWFRKLANARQVTMESMAAIAETRDPETGAHIKRTQHYVRAIAQRLRDTGQQLQTLTPEYIDLLFVSAPLHDIGKVGVPDHILLKPGKLTDDEFVLMKKHAEYGRDIIQSTAQKIEGDNFLQIAGEIAATHHEKWDGSGYPLGLAGEAIPISGRIMAVADVYDALISQRCYKPPFPHGESLEIMRKSRGVIFDPAVFDAFLSVEPRILEIAARFKDESEMILGDR